MGAGPVRAQTTPTLSVEASATTVGAPVVVRGEGWPPARLAQVQVCGNQAGRGSPDCDQGRAVTVPVEADGSFATLLTLAVPPVACPCVVRGTSAGGPQAVVVPITLDGTPPAARVVGAADRPDRRLEITGAELAGGGPWAAWFGAPPRRTVSFTVRNVGNVVVTDPAFTIAVGRGEHPSGLVDAPRLGSLAPGEERVYVVGVDFGPAAFGSYTVRGDVTGLDQPAGFQVKGSAHPWLGVVSIAVIAQLVLLGWRNRLRSRLVPAEAAGAVPVVVAAAEPDWVREPDDDADDIAVDFDFAEFERQFAPGFAPDAAPDLAPPDGSRPTSTPRPIPPGGRSRWRRRSPSRPWRSRWRWRSRTRSQRGWSISRTTTAAATGPSWVSERCGWTSSSPPSARTASATRPRSRRPGRPYPSGTTSISRRSTSGTAGGRPRRAPDHALTKASLAANRAARCRARRSRRRGRCRRRRRRPGARRR